MILTEAEARKKECQLRFNAALSLATLEGMMLGNGRMADEQKLELIAKTGRCTASDCMLGWRWHDPQRKDAPAIGYCGLAGKPE